MRKNMIACMCLLLAAVMAVTVFAEGTGFSLTATTQTVRPGESITLEASVSSSEPATSYGLMLSYDADVFELVDGSCTVEGALITSFKNGFAFMFQEPVVYSGPVGMVTLKAKETAPLGSVTVSGKASAKNDDVTVEIDGCELGLTVVCPHSFGAWTAADDTMHKRSCLKCREEETADHNWNGGVITTEPTEESAGIRTYTCTVCDATKTESISVLDHRHSYTSVTTSPTCTNAGFTTYTCACGDSYTGDEVAAMGHEKVTRKGYAATCTAAGLTDGIVCERCDKVLADQETIPAAGHRYIEGVCSVCGESEAAHKLEAPSILSCYSKLQTSVKVTWSLAEGADGYELWRAVNAEDSTDWIRVKTITDGTTDRYTNQDLAVGTTYYYKVRAFTEDAEGNRTFSDFSNVAYMPAAVVWDAPYSNATFRIRLRWQKTGGAHGYQIWRLDENGQWKIVKTLGDKGNTLTDDQGTTTAYSNTGLQAGENYTYKIRSFMITTDGRKVFGAYSDAVTVAAMPEAPVLNGSSSKETRAQLSWNAVNGAAGYQVWMLDDGRWCIVKSVSDGSTHYTKHDLQSGTEYSFRVRAYAEVGGKKTFGAYSEIVTVIVK